MVPLSLEISNFLFMDLLRANSVISKYIINSALANSENDYGTNMLIVFGSSPASQNTWFCFHVCHVTFHLARCC